MNDRALPASPWRPTTQQRIFRRLLDCFAHPGRIGSCVDAGREAPLAVLAALTDGATTLADPHGRLSPADWPLLEARPEAAERAAFVLADGGRGPDFAPCLGTLAAPEAGATLVLALAALGRGPRLRLAGPGIAAESMLAVDGLDPGWLSARAQWVAQFPLGVDLILCDGTRFAALPRSTRILGRNG